MGLIHGIALMLRPDRDRNRLLSLIPESAFDHLARYMEKVRVPLKTVVCDSEQPIEQVHFPLDCVFSSVITLKDGTNVEAAAVGNEGMTGTGLLIDDPISPYQIIQQVEGESLQVPSEVFQGILTEYRQVRQVVEKFTFSLLRNCAQNGACNLHHDVHARMCRWLLTCADRVTGSEFYITQEFLGEMLGVRRQSVNLTAGQLQQAGLIKYSRGRIKIVDRIGLENASCECYQVTKSNYERLLGTPAFTT